MGGNGLEPANEKKRSMIQAQWISVRLIRSNNMDVLRIDVSFRKVYPKRLAQTHLRWG
jgi:hypothetical protein